MERNRKTPGVYTVENDAFPNSVVPVATAVPAFVGYTERASTAGKDLTGQPTRLSSLAEFQHYFGGAPNTTYSVIDRSQEGSDRSYGLTPLEGRFLMFNSMRLFFVNGGSDCYVVSVGDYSSPVDRKTLEGGLAPLLKESEPTLLVIPDAMLLEQADCYALQQKMLDHCGNKMRNRIAILDIYEGYLPESSARDKDIIRRFRTGIGDHFLEWGAAYYPWLETTIVGADEVDFTRIDATALPTLQEMLREEVRQERQSGLLKQARAREIEVLIQALPGLSAGAKPAGPVAEERPTVEPLTESAEQTPALVHQQLLAVSPLYKQLMTTLREELNLLPPSAAMAGVYTMIDNQIGVWQSPANVSLGSVIQPAVAITNEQQEDLNVPLDGKAVNAMRQFPGKGTLVWGARTLDGNSPDWRYVSVRRTVIYIEQSVKNAAAAYVFQPNTAATWRTVKSALSNFLTTVWNQGALAGATPQAAYSVLVGLGETMTPVDVLDGFLRITIKVAVTRPEEFIVITFQQQMQQA